MVSFFLLILMMAAGAEAGKVDTGATQALGVASGSIELSDHTKVRSSAHYFWVPSDGVTIFFAYAGPVFSGHRGWLAPQVGVAGNWNGHDAAIASLWGGTELVGLNFFGEVDGYLANGYPVDLYYYCAVDHGNHFNVGLQCEGVNTNPTFGPHVGFTAGALHLEFQVYVDPDETTIVAPRVLVGLNFEEFIIH